MNKCSSMKNWYSGTTVESRLCCLINTYATCVHCDFKLCDGCLPSEDFYVQTSREDISQPILRCPNCLLAEDWIVNYSSERPECQCATKHRKVSNRQKVK